ncbi:AAA family ATPase [Leptospira sp. 96542]|nr:AAA family ATPase [Leptospira sp. 96542]
MKSKNFELGLIRSLKEIFPYLKEPKEEFAELFLKLNYAMLDGDLCLPIESDSLFVKSTYPLPFKVLNQNGENFLYFEKTLEDKISLENNLKKFLSKEQNPATELGIDPMKILSDLEELYRQNSFNPNFQLEIEQKQTILNSTKHGLQLIVGGPGTGKTTVVSFILSLFQKLSLLPDVDQIVLVAPTGRAAQRLTESLQNNLTFLGMENNFIKNIQGQTIHSVLKINPTNGKPFFDQNRTFTYDLMIVDEVSMVDLRTMRMFFDALDKNIRIILLGDPNQLPSVEKGEVLSDFLTEFDKFPNRVSKLIHSKRYKQGTLLYEISEILKLSFLKPSSLVPKFEIPNYKIKDLENANEAIIWIKNQENNELSRDEFLVWVWSHYFKQTCLEIANLHWKESDLQSPEAYKIFTKLNTKYKCLTILKKGYFGIESFHDHIIQIAEKEIFSNKQDFSIGHLRLNNQFYFEGMPLLIVRNDRIRNLFNGDIGFVIKIEDELRAVFAINHQLFSFALDTLPNHTFAFFLTVHKSQGSEYDNVVFYLPRMSESNPENELPLLNRKIMYTAITRAKKQVLLAGSEKSWTVGLQNYRKRITGFSLRT